MKLSDLEDALAVDWPAIYRDTAPSRNDVKSVTDYIVSSVYGLRDIYGDNHAACRLPRFQLDAYSQARAAKDPDGWFMSILDTLDSLGLPYDVQDVGYDPDCAAMRCIIQGELI